MVKSQFSYAGFQLKSKNLTNQAVRQNFYFTIHIAENDF